ncbi:hypothetical protein DQ04_08501020 [Trypanosoma grayi]|uniref:hypothetical protein n=1 Tax=Trypanosoma grayi TaxID=71804 RepID=UPI0004F4B4C0|nr:hypothetical protein DQ04_08501020 [Trypanosoma grayi]KEG07908.1 hypothetical protein DQ04_08501020 [Trypanosoma grayi]
MMRRFCDFAKRNDVEVREENVPFFYCKSTTGQEQRGAIHKNFVDLTGLREITGSDISGRPSTKDGRKPHKTGPPHGEMGIGSHQRYVGIKKRSGYPAARQGHSRSVGRNRSTLKGKCHSPPKKKGHPHCRLGGPPKDIQNRPAQSGAARGYQGWGDPKKAIGVAKGAAEGSGPQL